MSSQASETDGIPRPARRPGRQVLTPRHPVRPESGPGEGQETGAGEGTEAATAPPPAVPAVPPAAALASRPVTLVRTPQAPVSASADVEMPAAVSTAVAVADTVPDPHAPLAQGPLIDVEADELAACESAITDQQLAFVWGVGKALDTIRLARLYRATHARFEAYVSERWDMSASRAYQYIDAWRLARKIALSPRVKGKRVNEAQFRELAAFTRAHGIDAAEHVYLTVAEVDGVTVTARVLKDVTGILPQDHFDEDEATALIRQHLTTGRPLDKPAPPSDAERLDGVTAGVRKALEEFAKVTSAGDPDAVRNAVVEMRRVLDEILASIGSGTSDGAAPGSPDQPGPEAEN